jgi:transcriptional regulator with GAF, ATPase, and Fis domain
MPAEDSTSAAGTLKAATRMLERDMLIDALKRNGGNVTLAAGELGITPRMVRYKVQQLKLGHLRSARRQKRRD